MLELGIEVGRGGIYLRLPQAICAVAAVVERETRGSKAPKRIDHWFTLKLLLNCLNAVTSHGI